MVLAVLIVVITALVAWALRLMRSAVEQREFSLMLAGLLVSSAAAGIIGVYFLMSSCMSYMTTIPVSSGVQVQDMDVQDWNRAFVYGYSESTQQQPRHS
ncbi:MAG: hypothetical protein AAFQ57_06770 [Cyanobacteria bacterium J06626_14]